MEIALTALCCQGSAPGASGVLLALSRDSSPGRVDPSVEAPDERIMI
jgi:hypothetical protein